MTSKDEALKLAFEALTATMSTHGFRDAIDEAHDKAITAIEEVWAQPEEQRSCDRRTWVGLTKSQVLDLWEQTYVQRGTTGIEFALAIEAKLKEKNT